VFLAKALVYARNRGLLKLASTVGLTVLSASEKEGAKKAFRLAFRHVVQIPDDLREFVELCKKAQIRKGKRVKVVTKVKDGKRVVVDRQVMPGQGGLGGLAKLCVQNWLRHMSEFHAVKYGSDASKGITLPDIVKLAHPSASSSAGSSRAGTRSARSRRPRTRWCGLSSASRGSPTRRRSSPSSRSTSC